MPDVAAELSPEQIAFFHRVGYLAIDALTTPDETAWLSEVYDRLFNERAGREEGKQFDLAGTDEEGKPAALPQILNPSRYASELNDSQLLRNAAVVGRQLLGPDAEARFAHAIFKPARSGAPTPWHQDAAYGPPDQWLHAVSIWVPLQEATLENGCMQFAPRTHEMAPEVLPHQSINNDPRIHGLELRPDQHQDHVQNAVACPLPPGGATIHGRYMLHYTGPNRSDIPRRALILKASVAPEPLAESRRFPWQEQRHTARDERARAAKARKS